MRMSIPKLCSVFARVVCLAQGLKQKKKNPETELFSGVGRGLVGSTCKACNDCGKLNI